MQLKNLGVVIAFLACAMSAVANPLPAEEVSTTLSEVKTSTKIPPSTRSKVPPTTSSKLSPATKAPEATTKASKAPPSTTSKLPPSTSSKLPPSTTSKLPPTTSSKLPPSTTSKLPPTTSSKLPPSTTSKLPPTTKIVESTIVDLPTVDPTTAVVEPTSIVAEPSATGDVDVPTESNALPVDELPTEADPVDLPIDYKVDDDLPTGAESDTDSEDDDDDETQKVSDEPVKPKHKKVCYVRKPKTEKVSNSESNVQSEPEDSE